MVKDIVMDDEFLAVPSTDVTIADLSKVEDLIDTFNAHKEECSGLAGNMIGYQKNMIIVEYKNSYLVLLNPKIIKQSVMYKTTEGCLSHEGEKECRRYQHIKVTFQDVNFKKFTKDFDGYTAEVVQHEIDHLKGILI